MKIVLTCEAGHTEVHDVSGHTKEWVEGYVFVLNKIFESSKIIGKCCVNPSLYYDMQCGKPITAKVQE